MNKRVTIVTYHYVRPVANSRWPGINGLELALFKGQLDYIKRHYTPVSMNDIILAGRDIKYPLPHNAILLSFDDGYSDHWRHAYPELKLRGIRGAFYAPSHSLIDRQLLDVNKIHFVLAACSDHNELVAHIDGVVEEHAATFDLPAVNHFHHSLMKPSRWDRAETVYVKRILQHGLPPALRTQIASDLFRKFISQDTADFAEELYLSPVQAREMIDGGMHFGSHGDAHIWLSRVSEAEQRADISNSFRMFEALGVSSENFTFCYPYGAYTPATVSILRDLGCAAALTTRLAIAELNPNSMLELARIDAAADIPFGADMPINLWTASATTQG
jgi:peptidoglycan/xylan/chitin deacetylase (PgdA/CDA1 family)